MKTINTFTLFIILITIPFVFFQCDDIIEEVNLNETQIQLLAPSDSVTLSPGKITYTWASANNQLNSDTINILYYHFQLATPSFKEALQIIKDTVTTQTHISDSLNTTGEYEWRVKAFYNSSTSTEYTTYQLNVK